MLPTREIPQFFPHNSGSEKQRATDGAVRDNKEPQVGATTPLNGRTRHSSAALNVFMAWFLAGLCCRRGKGGGRRNNKKRSICRETGVHERRKDVSVVRRARGVEEAKERHAMQAWPGAPSLAPRTIQLQQAQVAVQAVSCSAFLFGSAGRG